MPKKQSAPAFLVVDGIVYAKTKRDIAAFFDVSYHTVNKDWSWVPKREKHGYNLLVIAQIRHQRLSDAPSANIDSNNNSLRTARVEKINEEIRAKRVSTDEKEGRLVSADAVRHDLVHWGIRFRDPLLALVNSIAAIVPGSVKAQVMHLVEEEVRAALIRVREMKFQGDTIADLICDEAERIKKGET